MLTFDKAQTMTTLNVGATLAIPVQVSGLPVPEVTWTFSDKLVYSSYVTGDSTSTNLTMKSLEPLQQGVYTLTAVNIAGETSATFTVNLLGEHDTLELCEQL